MNYSFQSVSLDTAAFQKNWKWFLIWGIVLMILGLLAISFATLTTLFSVIFLGAILVASGIFVMINAYQLWWRKSNGFTPHFLLGLFYFILGAMLLLGPLTAALSLTLLLATFFILIGIFRIIYSLALQLPRWGWSLFNGIISLLLGILILMKWPTSGLFILGLFVGIDLFLIGWTYVMVALFAKTQKS